MAVEYDSDRTVGHIEWVDNWRTGKTPANTKFSSSDFSAYFPRETLEKCIEAHKMAGPKS